MVGGSPARGVVDGEDHPVAHTGALDERQVVGIFASGAVSFMHTYLACSANLFGTHTEDAITTANFVTLRPMQQTTPATSCRGSGVASVDAIR